MSINKKLFSKAAGATDTFVPSKNFNTVLYTGTGAIHKVGAYINQGAEFNGSNSKIDIDATSSTPIDFSNKNFTISAWINGKGFTTDDRTIVSKYSGSNNSTSSFFFDVRDNDQKLRVTEINGTSALGLQSNDSISENTWTHVVYVRTSTTCEFFINGSTSGGSQSRTSNINDGGTTTISIGERQANKRFDGKIDQVRFFNRALTSSEVTTLYGETFDSATKSTTDIFGDRSGVALYQLDGNANDTGGASGYFNEGAIFNGSDSTVIIPNTDLFNTTSRLSFSVSFWFKSTSTGSNALVTDYPPVSGNYSFFVTLESGVLKCGNFYSGGFSGTIAGSTTVNDGNWHHAVLVNNTSDNTQKVYLDGNSTPEISTTLTSGTKTSQNLVVGFFYGISYYYLGILDELRVYSDVLTTTEIAYIYSNTSALIPTDNLEAYYKFDGTFQDEQQTHDGVGSNVTFRYDGTASNVSFQGSLRFALDLLWVKNRDASVNHILWDSVRTNYLFPNLTNQEEVTSDITVNTNGWTTAATNALQNSDGVDYTAWCWKGGGAAVTNDTGSRDTQVSANTAAGFSIVSLNKPDTNTDTYGHGLTSAPEMIILKRTASDDDWHVYHKDLGNTVRISLNSSNQKVTGTGVWGSTTPTISDFTLQNQTGGAHIAYCMHSVDNYQKIGSYTGNGSAVGPVVSTGFEVGWLLIKRTDANGTNWRIIDNKRDTTNPRANYLNADTNEAEETAYDQVNFLTNGFQLAATDTSINNNGSLMIYWAIAADPSTASTPAVTNAFDVVNYTGNGSTQEILTDTNPDLVLIKGTDTGSSSSGNFVFFDTVRDAGSETDAPHFLASNLTNGEFGNANTGVVSFDEKGFTVTDDANGGGNVNGASGGLYSNGSYTAFLWSAGSHEGNLPTINTQGTLDSTVSVNDAAGFSTLKFTSNGAASVVSAGHGLSAEPELVIFKNMDNTSHWMVYVSSVGDNGYLKLDSTDDITSFTPFFDITSTTIGIRQSSLASSGEGCIAYCWYSVSGYSKIGTYSGNNSATTVYTTDNGLSSGSNGFKPRWVMMKRTSAAGNWLIWDSINNPSADNDNNDVIYANKADARSDAGSGRYISFNSNGFTISGDSGDSNSNGHTYLYFAIK